jgi:hypothetical protein
MNSLAKNNDPKFTRMVIRDFFVFSACWFISGLGIVVILYFSIKYNW